MRKNFSCSGMAFPFRFVAKFHRLESYYPTILQLTKSDYRNPTCLTPGPCGGCSKPTCTVLKRKRSSQLQFAVCESFAGTLVSLLPQQQHRHLASGGRRNVDRRVLVAGDVWHWVCKVGMSPVSRLVNCIKQASARSFQTFISTWPPLDGDAFSRGSTKTKTDAADSSPCPLQSPLAPPACQCLPHRNKNVASVFSSFLPRTSLDDLAIV